MNAQNRRVGQYQCRSDSSTWLHSCFNIWYHSLWSRTATPKYGSCSQIAIDLEATWAAKDKTKRLVILLKKKLISNTRQFYEMTIFCRWLDWRATQEANQSYVGSHGDHFRRLLDAAQLCSPNHGVQFWLPQEALLLNRVFHRSRHRHVLDHLQSIPVRLAQCQLSQGVPSHFALAFQASQMVRQRKHQWPG